MPLPDYMPTESSPTRTPKKKAPPKSLSNQSTMEVLGLTKPTEQLYEQLNAQPLPTQGNVADLVSHATGMDEGEAPPSIEELLLALNTAAKPAAVTGTPASDLAGIFKPGEAEKRILEMAPEQKTPSIESGNVFAQMFGQDEASTARKADLFPTMSPKEERIDAWLDKRDDIVDSSKLSTLTDTLTPKLLTNTELQQMVEGGYSADYYSGKRTASEYPRGIGVGSSIDSWANLNMPELEAELAKRIRTGDPGPGTGMLAERRQAAIKQARGEKPEVEQMTWDEFNALNPQQQAAVKFNSLLVQAVRRDRKQRKLGNYDDVTPEQLKTYQTASDNMFGEDGGSLRYAPETMNVLQQVDLDVADIDLDDFLSLRAAITEDDLKNLKPNIDKEVPLFKDTRHEDTVLGDVLGAPLTKTESVEPKYGGLEGLEEARVDLAHRLATGTAALEQELGEAGTLLDTWRNTAYIDPDRQAGLEAMGATPRNLPLSIGFGAPTYNQGEPTNLDAYFQNTYELMARTDGAGMSIEQRIAAAREAFQALGKPEVIEDFYRYLDLRSKQASEYALPLGQEKNVQYRSPQEFRQLLGLEKGVSRG